MSKAKVTFQQTPNPNALKCGVAGTIPSIAGMDGPRSYSRGADVSGDPLAAALLEIPGITQVLITEQWATVNREPGKDWKQIKSAVQAVLGEHVKGGNSAGKGEE